MKLQFSYSLCAILVVTVSLEYCFTFKEEEKLQDGFELCQQYLSQRSGRHLCHPKKKGACSVYTLDCKAVPPCVWMWFHLHCFPSSDLHPVTSARICDICIFVFCFLYPCIRDAFVCMLNIIIVLIVACKGVLRSAVHPHLLLASP